MNKTFPYKTILVACSVNTARSRMAEGYLQKFCGMLISMDAKLAMREEDIHLSETALSVDLKKKEHRHRIEKADLILTLTEQHKEEIKQFVKNNHKEIYTLKEFAGECGDIEDPSMKGIEGFRIARDKIKDCLNKGLQKYF